MGYYSESNYYSDHRVAALDRERGAFNQKLMTLTFSVIDDEEEEEAEVEVTLPARFEVCETCSGKGTHVNPSIDSGGLSSDDFAEDPDFAEAYFGGAYDTVCYGCKGERVEPVVDEARLNSEQKRQYAMVRKTQRERADYEVECRHEREMGC